MPDVASSQWEAIFCSSGIGEAGYPGGGCCCVQRLSVELLLEKLRSCVACDFTEEVRIPDGAEVVLMEISNSGRLESITRASAALCRRSMDVRVSARGGWASVGSAGSDGDSRGD